MTARRMREGPSGRVRPCSQFLTVAGLNPNRTANWDWLRPSFWRTDRTSIAGARLTSTTVTRTPRDVLALRKGQRLFGAGDEPLSGGGVFRRLPFFRLTVHYGLSPFGVL